MIQEKKRFHTLNLKGEICPYTFVKSKLVLEELHSGDLLSIIIDNLKSIENVPKAIQNSGHEVLSIQQINEQDWEIVVEKL